MDFREMNYRVFTWKAHCRLLAEVRYWGARFVGEDLMLAASRTKDSLDCPALLHHTIVPGQCHITGVRL